MKMDKNKRIIQYVNRAKQLATNHKATDVDVHDQELTMTILGGLPSKFEHLIVAIYAVADDQKPTLDFVKRRLLQEYQQMSDRGSSTKSNPDFALVGRCGNDCNARAVPTCTH